MYQWNFAFLVDYRGLLLSGLLYTLGYTVLCIVLGLLFGLVAGIGQLSPSKWISAPLKAYVEIFRCTPVLIQLIWFYYALPSLLGIEMSASTAAVLALSLYGGAFYSEIIRGGIISIDPGQRLAPRRGAMHGHRPVRVRLRT